jgi:heptosyltransferase-2
LTRTLSGGGIEEALVLAPSFRAALLPLMVRANRRIGMRSDARAALLTDALPVPNRDEHLAVQYLHLAGHLGADPKAPLDPVLPIGADEREAAKERLASLDVDGRQSIALCPGATYGDTKRWPPSRWIELARILSDRGRKLIVLGSGDESVLGGRIEEMLDSRARNLAGKLSIRESLAALTHLAGAVSNDSGAMHLAAAAGCPVIGLFGSTNPAWTGPLGSRSRAITLGLPCSPCYRRTCPTEIECLRDLSAEHVAEETCRLIGDEPRGTA